MNESDFPQADPDLLARQRLKPMEAVQALYAPGNPEVAQAIVASLSRRIFGDELPPPAPGVKRRLAALVYRMLLRTTRPEQRTREDGEEVTIYRNRLLERSGHPYALTLLEPGSAATASLVEGGDPMNAPYMMLIPEIRANGGLWDKLLLDSVQGRDVQLRFSWETRFTHQVARQRLESGESVRIKSVAAGTGLSLILVYDRLLRDGFEPERIRATLSDRDPVNMAKAQTLLEKLATTRANLAQEDGPGISARIEDLFDASSNPNEPPHHLVTVMGLLEYFPGETCATAHEHLSLPGHPGDGMPHAREVLERVAGMTDPTGQLIANSYRVEPGARILEIFGKKLHYRNRENLLDLVQSAGFSPTGEMHSGHVYDVAVFGRGDGAA